MKQRVVTAIVTFAAVTAAMLVPLVARMSSEEALLSARFGAEYDAYRRRPWRLIPGLY